MPNSNINILKPPSSHRTFELIHLQPVIGKEGEKFKARKEEGELDTDFLRFVLEELVRMQQRIGELRFAVAAMTTLVKDKLEQDNPHSMR
ncbi:MAG TPA: hypothetical protein VE398_05370 [Acidobacteriota bacterium]|nr:hypothetical protein [Acidobacteriota bacterium]